MEEEQDQINRTKSTALEQNLYTEIAANDPVVNDIETVGRDESLYEKLMKYSFFVQRYGVFIKNTTSYVHPSALFFTFLVILSLFVVIATKMMKLNSVYQCCSTIFISQDDPLYKQFDIVAPDEKSIYVVQDYKSWSNRDDQTATQLFPL